jgi:hypothetical protein
MKYTKKETMPKLSILNIILQIKGKLYHESGIFGENKVNST